ncbi:LUD domain-containing protein [Mesonia sp. K7]|uniref:LUD domain-containing protein n=1 Tax=Mesonia sp. K7 TaxID=2218606 RepID=UPI000DA7A734|nr:LUD domain-containing protein [Mesonia sp. K7]PZD78319.1 lactate utilization protein B/C [Mesonia sp. K7]
MSIIKKILKFTSKSDEENVEPRKVESKFMPEEEAPTDENFMENFKKNGGKFLYCADMDEVHIIFQKILDENNWHDTEVFCRDNQLRDTFKDFNLTYGKKSEEASFFLTTCEYLIGNTGALLISSNQIGEKKLIELPHNFVVLAGTSQLVNGVSEGLRGIKNKSTDRIPTNITTIKTFENKPSDDFMSYGSTSKNLYLLLLEDL